jgi:hypothetical protein
MALTTSVKSWINRWLAGVNLRLETLTAERIEEERLEVLVKAGHFNRAIFPLLQAFDTIQITPTFGEITSYSRRFNDFQVPSCNSVGYSFDNEYFSSPDTEVAYTIVRKFEPKTIIEVGSGHSTKILRQAILDAQLHTRLICIDPTPRVEITGLADEMYRERVESLRGTELFQSLQSRDILFSDSSHAITTGNDVVFLYLIILPLVRPGVLIHIHDIFLPYDYPEKWVVHMRWGWNEQYLIQALLMETTAFEVLWAGYFLQRTQPDFDHYFPHLQGRTAQSLWLRKGSTDF